MNKKRIMHKKGYIGVPKVAKILDVSTARVYNLIDKEYLKAEIGSNGIISIKESDVINLKKEMKI